MNQRVREFESLGRGRGQVVRGPVRCPMLANPDRERCETGGSPEASLVRGVTANLIPEAMWPWPSTQTPPQFAVAFEAPQKYTSRTAL